MHGTPAAHEAGLPVPNPLQGVGSSSLARKTHNTHCRCSKNFGATEGDNVVTYNDVEPPPLTHTQWHDGTTPRQAGEEKSTPRSHSSRTREAVVTPSTAQQHAAERRSAESSDGPTTRLPGRRSGRVFSPRCQQLLFAGVEASACTASSVVVWRARRQSSRGSRGGDDNLRSVEGKNEDRGIG